MNSNTDSNSNTNTLTTGDDQVYITIEKYLLLIMLEFQEHLGKYKGLYSNVSDNNK
jgi:hypothetical protein